MHLHTLNAKDQDNQKMDQDNQNKDQDNQNKDCQCIHLYHMVQYYPCFIELCVGEIKGKTQLLWLTVLY